MCRTGCVTKNHASWGECARASLIQVGDITGRDTNRAWDYELDRYEAAVRQGIEPLGTQLHQTMAAEAHAQDTGIGDVVSYAEGAGWAA